jgi:hypothetical protein
LSGLELPLIGCHRVAGKEIPLGWLFVVLLAARECALALPLLVGRISRSC